MTPIDDAERAQHEGRPTSGTRSRLIDDVLARLEDDTVAANTSAHDDEESPPDELQRVELVRRLQNEARDALDREAQAVRLPSAQVTLALRLKEQLEFDDARGEIGLAQQFARIAFGQHFRSLPREKLWVKYDAAAGIYRDGDTEARELVKLLISATIDRARRGLRAATRRGGPDDVRAANQVLAAAKRLQRASTISAVLDAARTDPTLVTELRLFDANRDELVVHNGVLDLRTGRLRPHSPDNLVRKRAGTHYDPAASCPTWRRFIVQIMRGDRSLIRFLQQAIGYTLTGHVREEMMFFKYGGGMNGKSVVANVVQAMMSDYYVRVSGDFLMATPQGNREGATPGMARIAGARIVMANEVESSAVLSGQQLKVLVSTETISARELYRAPFEFEPTHKVWVRGNHKPIARDTDYGFWRRIALIPFLFTIDKAKADPTLQDKLLNELPGILRWAVDGARRWYEEGRLTTPRAVREATAQYQTDSDVIANWMSDTGWRLAPGESAPGDAVYESYKTWAVGENLRPMSRNALTNRLQDMSVRSERRKVGGFNVRYYVGLKESM
jgi:putative DNA primase/helicase